MIHYVYSGCSLVGYSNDFALAYALAGCYPDSWVVSPFGGGQIADNGTCA